MLEGGRIFADPLAARILGRSLGEIAEDAAANPDRRGMRLFIAARTRFAEDAAATAVAAGARQLVVLGAGLDTFAYRHPHQAAGLRVFEVDHPATQAWKRERLAQAGIEPPASLTYSPVDFEREALGEGLRAAGFDPGRSSVFLWLGVVPYLTAEAAMATLGYIAALAGGAVVVFDYADPAELLSPDQKAARTHRAARVAAWGEPWLSYFTAEALAGDLRALGFTSIEDLDPARISARYFGAPAPAGPSYGGHIIRAATLDFA